MIVLGIETSCDETAVAIVRSDRTLLSNQLISQLKEHEIYGGVVPEIAARAHLDHLAPLVERACHEAKITLQDVDAIAAAGGPGLIGGVIVGVMMAKALALALGRPFIAVNHLEAHALTVRLCEAVPFPYFLLLVSGGHCQILKAQGIGHYRVLGQTIDDAIGEAFDKVGKMMGLSYPAGPLVERFAQQGDGYRFSLPRPLIHTSGCNFSFSGLKTAVRQYLQNIAPITAQDQADMCASFQRVVGDILVNRCIQALALDTGEEDVKHFVVAGGVAANLYLRDRLKKVMEEKNIRLVAPPIELCTDNGAMIAWAGLERLNLGLVDSLDFAPKPRWPLTTLKRI